MRRVVVDHLALGEAGLRVEHLVQVGQLQLACPSTSTVDLLARRSCRHQPVRLLDRLVRRVPAGTPAGAAGRRRSRSVYLTSTTTSARPSASPGRPATPAGTSASGQPRARCSRFCSAAATAAGQPAAHLAGEHQAVRRSSWRARASSACPGARRRSSQPTTAKSPVAQEAQLDPVAGAHARAVARGEPLGHHALEPVLARCRLGRRRRRRRTG